MNHGIHGTHEKAETLAEIMAEMRIFRCRDLSTGKLEVCNAIANYFADRIEAAWKREKAEAEALALSVGGMVEASRHKPDPDWKATCAKCHDGEIEPTHCEYYGEPNGCNSPIYGEHPQSAPIGDAAAMREVVTALAAVILPPRDKAGEDGWLAWVRAMQGKARAALAAPLRNCDKLSAKECKRIFAKEMTTNLPPEATDNDRTIATLTANGVIDALYATSQVGGYDGSK